MVEYLRVCGVCGGEFSGRHRDSARVVHRFASCHGGNRGVLTRDGTVGHTETFFICSFCWKERFKCLFKGKGVRRGVG